MLLYTVLFSILMPTSVKTVNQPMIVELPVLRLEEEPQLNIPLRERRSSGLLVWFSEDGKKNERVQGSGYQPEQEFLTSVCIKKGMTTSEVSDLLEKHESPRGHFGVGVCEENYRVLKMKVHYRQSADGLFRVDRCTPP